jgi:hypothetical protein
LHFLVDAQHPVEGRTRLAVVPNVFGRAFHHEALKR